ncbi:HAD-IC family P-type ATPase [Sneathiella sp. P13V-1]|uniref:cation-translocating P-type ATPase n=1 Tax=Sneathiella sp. P13V-1 TaxID=2697366 RepID=UPI00187B80B5|nr:HAD-IC family P-type ATPase [Sneathiella sp. P13V-1]MBE7636177.1 HAD-IC family P-type ATPase [Sneathiella sp. P13V-1]
MKQQIEPHNCKLHQVFEAYNTSEEGLSAEKAKERLSEYGRNSLPLAPPKPAWVRFITQFQNVLIYVLIFSAIVSAILHHYVDSGVIFAVVIVNAVVGFIQEGKAEQALRAILTMTTSQCLVVRNGDVETVDSGEVVPGDVVMLQAGDRVPADIRLIFSRDFRCDESPLTGEAHPVGKQTDVLAGDVVLAERTNMAFMGTMITYGMARGVVTHTGVNTQIGQISELVKRVVLAPTPLQVQLTKFAKQLTGAIIVFSALTVFLGVWLHGHSYAEMLRGAIGIAVSSIPEGLPAIVTIALAIGVQRMAKNRALVRRLPGVEVLGSVDVICSDKTGTLTANAMSAREVFTSRGVYHITGEGYAPKGSIQLAQSSEHILIDGDPCFSRACLAAALCNDARIEHENSDWILHGDPTEGALAVLAMKHGLVPKELNREWPRLDILPFESEKRYMATLHHNADGQVELMIKGAPERLLDFAGLQLGVDGPEPLDKERWLAAAQDFARRGMRVMALALKEYPSRPSVLSHKEVEADLVMLGLVGMSDPPRAEAIESIKACHSAGITVKMITGDNPVTAAAIGSELGLDVSRVLTGKEIDELTKEQLATEVEKTDVFARTSPANKLQLVNALQQNKHVVAMTGDGVNDAPALKKADIGIAMGHKGTDAAKEAADFVLTDDNFATIAKAVREGRTVYDNIVKSIVFVLPTNLAEAFVVFVSILFGRMMPITPAQILWINMVTAITLALALAFEKPESRVMERPPRAYDSGLFTLPLLVRMCLVGSLGATVVFALFYAYRDNGVSIEYARTVSINALVMIEVFYLLNCRFLTESIFKKTFLKGIAPTLIALISVISLQLIFSYLTVSQKVFGLENISLNDWVVIICVTAPILLMVELEKAVYRLIHAKWI